MKQIYLKVKKVKISIIALIFCLLNIHSISSQDKMSDYDMRLTKVNRLIKEEVRLISKNNCLKEWILYSMFNLDYNLVITKQDDEEYKLYLFSFLKSSEVPELLYYSKEVKNTDDLGTLFKPNTYWTERIFYQDNYEYQESFLDNNKSDFYFFDSNDMIVAEFHLPTIMDNHPLKKNHQYLLDLRMKLILKYIL